MIAKNPGRWQHVGVAKRNLICWMLLIWLEKPLSVMPEFRSVSYPVRVHAGTNALARLADEADRLQDGPSAGGLRANRWQGDRPG